MEVRRGLGMRLLDYWIGGLVDGERLAKRGQAVFARQRVRRCRAHGRLFNLYFPCQRTLAQRQTDGRPSFAEAPDGRPVLARPRAPNWTLSIFTGA